MKKCWKTINKAEFWTVLRTKIQLTTCFLDVGKINLIYDLRCTIWAQMEEMAGYAPV